VVGGLELDVHLLQKAEPEGIHVPSGCSVGRPRVQEEAEAAAAAQSMSEAAAAARQQKRRTADAALPAAGSPTAPTGACQAAASVPQDDSDRQRPARGLGPGSGDDLAAPDSRQPAEDDSLAAAEADAAATGPVQVDIIVSECQEGGNKAAEAAASKVVQPKVSITIKVCQR
jgi:hypothetical protein